MGAFFVERPHPISIRLPKRGQAPRELEVYDLAKRATIDGEITERSVDFIKRKAGGKQPFFLYIPYTQPHMPVTPHPDFAGKTGNGDYADVLTQLDHYIGQLQKALGHIDWFLGEEFSLLLCSLLLHPVGLGL